MKEEKPMRVMGFNGSPRKLWNTATLLQKALEGAASKGARTELVHLYDLDYKGCVSCFACKKKGGKSYGRCAVKDDLTPVFKKIESADAVVFASPIYLGTFTGEMQSFLERLVFPYLTYTDPPGSLFPRKIPTGFIYTMGIPEEMLDQVGYRQRFANTQGFLTRTFGSSEMLLSCDTLQFEDYSRVVAPRFDPEKKMRRRQEVFPQECRKAFELGERLIQEA
jgi:multimeric flavodoxin WrbA